jgi:hypothetical protein
MVLPILETFYSLCEEALDQQVLVLMWMCL